MSVQHRSAHYDVHGLPGEAGRGRRREHLGVLAPSSNEPAESFQLGRWRLLRQGRKTSAVGHPLVQRLPRLRHPTLPFG